MKINVKKEMPKKSENPPYSRYISATKTQVTQDSRPIKTNTIQTLKSVNPA